MRHALRTGRRTVAAKDAVGDGTTKTARGRKRQDRSVQTRGRILSAATAEFVSAGFNGATSRSIAERADVPHGLVIYHFGTKLGVWRAVMEQAITDFHDALAAEAVRHGDGDAVAALRGRQRVFIRMSVSRPELNWLMSHEMGRDSERMSWLLEKIAGRDIDATIALIREVQSQGRYAAGDPAHLHFLFVGAASRVFLMPSEIDRAMGCSPFDDAFVERHIVLIQSLFFRDPPSS